ncbi:MAG TPA: short-chain dehydrogenase [Acidimicrobiaceae bacterium]|nr:short-chain dehydrogenase [Acidimicrobiaceae bacterium]
MTTGRGVAVVTGASAGVGRATALLLAESGFDVAVVARGRAGLEAAAKDVESTGRRSLVWRADVADPAALDDAAERIESDLGPVDVWVNNAMTTIFAPFTEIDPAEFRRAVEVTFLGQVWGTRAALARMQPRDRGTIVNVGSALGFVSIPLQSPYCASKAACRAFHDSVRAELLHAGSRVRLSLVHLPGVNTTQFSWCRSVFRRHPRPVAPVYQPEVAARRIVDVAVDGRRAKVVGSWNSLLVAAAKLVPGVANQYASIGAWDTQLADEPLSPDRPVNLWEPADDDADFGAHGIFDDEAGGVLDRRFLRSLPSTGRDLALAVGRRAREVAARVGAA